MTPELGHKKGSTTNHSRQDIQDLADIAVAAERWKDALSLMSQLSYWGLELTAKEGNQLAQSLQNVMKPLRYAWSELNRERNKFVVRGILFDTQIHVKLKVIEQYLLHIKIEAIDRIYKFTSSLLRHLLPTATSPEIKVLYLRLLGDCLRYLSTFLDGQDLRKTIEQGLAAYREASELGIQKLNKVNPTRISVMMNFAIFLCDVVQAPQAASALMIRTLQSIQEHHSETASSSWQQVNSEFTSDMEQIEKKITAEI